MIEKTALLVISCDKYSDLWPIYFESLFKYWPDCPLKIYLGSNYKKYNHDYVTNISIGEDSDYSSNLISMINKIDEEYVLTTVEDIFFSEQVDEENLFSYFNEFFQNHGAYLKLLYTFPVGYNKNIQKRTAVIPKDVRYRLGMGTSLWNKKILKQNLVPGMSAWEMERGGVFGFNIPEKDAYSINYYFAGEHPFKYVHGVMKGSWIRNAIPWLIKEGYQDLLPNRKKLSIYQTFYTWIFGILMYIFRKTKFRWKV